MGLFDKPNAIADEFRPKLEAVQRQMLASLNDVISAKTHQKLEKRIAAINDSIPVMDELRQRLHDEPDYDVARQAYHALAKNIDALHNQNHSVMPNGTKQKHMTIAAALEESISNRVQVTDIMPDYVAAIDRYKEATKKLSQCSAVRPERPLIADEKPAWRQMQRQPASLPATSGLPDGLGQGGSQEHGTLREATEGLARE